MPVSARDLYYQLGMSADDDGIVEAWNIMKLCNASDDDLDNLVRKGFVQILDSEDLIAFITDWDINNQIRKDRKHESIYKKLLISYQNNIHIDHLSLTANILQTQLPSDLQPCDNQVTTECQPSVNQVTTICQTNDGQVVDTLATEVRLGKVSIDKDSIGKVRLGYCDLQPTDQPEQIKNLFGLIQQNWNLLEPLGFKPIRIIGPGTERGENLYQCLATFGPESFVEVIDKIKQSEYLKGNNKDKWMPDFDWVVEPNNYRKILEDNYKEIYKPISKIRTFNTGTERPPEDFTKLEKQLLDN